MKHHGHSHFTDSTCIYCIFLIYSIVVKALPVRGYSVSTKSNFDLSDVIAFKILLFGGKFRSFIACIDPVRCT